MRRPSETLVRVVAVPHTPTAQSNMPKQYREFARALGGLILKVLRMAETNSLSQLVSGDLNAWGMSVMNGRVGNLRDTSPTVSALSSAWFRPSSETPAGWAAQVRGGGLAQVIQIASEVCLALLRALEGAAQNHGLAFATWGSMVWCTPEPQRYAQCARRGTLQFLIATGSGRRRSSRLARQPPSGVNAALATCPSRYVNRDSMES